MNTRSVQRTLLASAGLKALPVGVLTDVQGTPEDIQRLFNGFQSYLIVLFIHQT